MINVLVKNIKTKFDLQFENVYLVVCYDVIKNNVITM